MHQQTSSASGHGSRAATVRLPPRTGPLDDCLSIRDNHLYMEQVDCGGLTGQFGSPLFVFSEDQLRRNIREFQRAFSAHWPDGPVKIMPAAKANWLPAIQRIVALAGCGCATYSEGELAVALRSGIDPQFISVNGCPKSLAHIQRTVEAGARLTIDSTEDVTSLLQVLEQHPQAQARVRIRIRPTLEDFIEPSQFVAEGPLPTDLAALAYKGGLSLDGSWPICRELLIIRGYRSPAFINIMVAIIDWPDIGNRRCGLCPRRGPAVSSPGRSEADGDRHRWRVRLAAAPSSRHRL